MHSYVYNLKLCRCCILTVYISVVPTPNQVDVTTSIIQTVGQSLVLRCSVITVRGITSRVDIVWSSDGLDLETVEANVSSITNNSVEYTTYYTIVQLNETDDGRVYQCKVVINASPPVMTDGVNITVNATSKYSCYNVVCILNNATIYVLRSHNKIVKVLFSKISSYIVFSGESLL